MRDLLQFISRFSSFFIFLLLEGLCILLIVRQHNYQRVSFLNSAGTIVGSTLEAKHDVTEYLSLKAENDSLRKENAILRSSSINAFQFYTNIKDTVCSATIDQTYTFLPAEVLQNSTERANNYLTIDRGSKHGIRPEMGVMGANGAVGIVTGVSENFSVVMSILHSKLTVSAELLDTKYSGTVYWEGGSPRTAKLNGIPQHVKLNIGDKVVTSGFSSIFPSELPIGSISNFVLPDGSNFYEIEILLATDFQALSSVYIIDDLYKAERTALERSYE